VNGAATCKKDKAKVSFTAWNENLVVETQGLLHQMINPFTRQGAPFK